MKKKLKSKALRIGNWIKDGNEYEQVTINHLVGLDKGIFEFDPIELTQEWLLKCGMKKFTDTTPFNYRWNEKTKHIYFRYSDFGDKTSGFQALFMNGKYWTRIRYVHELQNLFFALTGEELQFSSNLD